MTSESEELRATRALENTAFWWAVLAAPVGLLVGLALTIRGSVLGPWVMLVSVVVIVAVVAAVRADLMF